MGAMTVILMQTNDFSNFRYICTLFDVGQQVSWQYFRSVADWEQPFDFMGGGGRPLKNKISGSDFSKGQSG